jgi:hypothetical protein
MQTYEPGQLVVLCAAYTAAHMHKDSVRPYATKDLFRTIFHGNDVVQNIGMVLELEPAEMKTSILFLGNTYDLVLFGEDKLYVKRKDLKAFDDDVE